MDILVVEDNKEYCGYLEQAANRLAQLRKHSVSISSVHCYQDYLNLAENKYDLVITDLFFPYSEDESINTKKVKEYWNFLKQKAKPFELKHFIDSKRGSMRCKDGTKDWESYECGDRTGPWMLWGKGKISDLPKNAPYGLEVFTDIHYRQQDACMLVTSSHAHSNEGSTILIYLQNIGERDWGSLPFESLRGGDFRLMTNCLKSVGDPRYKSLFDDDIVDESITVPTMQEMALYVLTNGYIFQNFRNAGVDNQQINLLMRAFEQKGFINLASDPFTWMDELRETPEKTIVDKLALTDSILSSSDIAGTIETLIEK